MQPTLFDVGRAHLPPRVLVFASGVNEAREIRGFSLARIPIGFSAGHVREEAITELHRSELPLFADSGAFSEVVATSEGLLLTNSISHQGWLDRLTLFQALAETHGSRLSLVVPDRVEDQEYTLGLLARYRQQLQSMGATGARLLVPVQRGALTGGVFYRQACDVAGVPMHPALPMKKAGMSHGQVLAFVRENRPAHVHLLGMGYQRTAAKKLINRLLNSFGKLTLSLDSNRLRAVTGQQRPMTQLETALRAAEPYRMYGDVEHPALVGAAEHLDYTEAIASPSLWAAQADLERVAGEAIPGSVQRRQFLENPDAYLQQDCDGEARWECPLLSAALDRAWSRYVETRVRAAVRTAAIHTTFDNAQIAA